MKPLDEFRELVADENVEPPLESALRLLSDSFRGAGAWESATQRLDELASSVDADDVAGTVRTLFGRGRLHGDKETYDDPRNSFLDHCLERGRGLPITLCLIAHLVCERVGQTTHLVGLPGHVVLAADAVRAERPQHSDRRFFDPFNDGRELSREQCLSISAMSGRPAQEGDLAPMSTRAIVVRILNNLSGSYKRLEDVAALSLCVGHRWAMPEIRRLDGPQTLALVRDLN